ncbi:MAG: hypothetical protein IPN36_04325 [Bacteroidetes bacterium]|nr:hypothetical protein [Bacteroidota bacterium]
MFPTQYTGQILQRYPYPNIITEEEKRRGFNDLVHELSVAFELPAEFNPKSFMHFPVDLIMDYIRRTHRLYIHRKLPEMEQSIHLLLQDYSKNHPLLSILLDFYSSYKVNLTLHICEEEQHLLPYIDFLLHAEKSEMDLYHFYQKSERYSLQEFEEDHHDDTEKDLQQIRETILMYDPPVTNTTPYRILLLQLQNFERDLTVHGLIEDAVLLPKMKVTENFLQEEFLRRLKNN